MSTTEEYGARAAESLAAAEGATNERDRAHHRRAYSVWRKLILHLGEAEARAASRPEKAHSAKGIAPRRN